MGFFSLFKLPGLFRHSTLQSASQQAEEINRLTFAFLAAAGLVVLVVTVLTAYSVYRFRNRPGAGRKPREISRKWEWAMIGIPSLMVAFFLFRNIQTMGRVLPRPDNRKPDIIITGHQWWWEARYPSANVVTANEIHLPAGKTVLLLLRSADVIHDWWVPELGNKMDLVPGRDNYLWLQVKAPGIYQGACSEFCGNQHAGMLLRVVAEPQGPFDQWLAAQAAPPAPLQDSGALAGGRLFTRHTCGNCHRISGTAAAGTTGPDLTHVASRSTLLTGLIRNNPKDLSAWIAHPQQIKPGALMPDFLLDPQSVKELTAYLTALE